jgi:hypothetical protein
MPYTRVSQLLGAYRKKTELRDVLEVPYGRVRQFITNAKGQAFKPRAFREMRNCRICDVAHIELHALELLAFRKVLTSRIRQVIAVRERHGQKLRILREVFRCCIRQIWAAAEGDTLQKLAACEMLNRFISQLGISELVHEQPIGIPLDLASDVHALKHRTLGKVHRRLISNQIASLKSYALKLRTRRKPLRSHVRQHCAPGEVHFLKLDAPGEALNPDIRQRALLTEF